MINKSVFCYNVLSIIEQHSMNKVSVIMFDRDELKIMRFVSQTVRVIGSSLMKLCRPTTLRHICYLFQGGYIFIDVSYFICFVFVC